MGGLRRARIFFRLAGMVVSHGAGSDLDVESGVVSARPGRSHYPRALSPRRARPRSPLDL